MAVKTTYICDKCGKEQDTNDQFWTVGVTAKHGIHPSKSFVKDKSIQVCRPCLESLGLHVTKKPEHGDASPAVPSVEDLIREIVHRCA